MRSNHTGPFNIGSEHMISIKELVNIVSKIANKILKIKTVDGPIGVAGRTSDNSNIKKAINWEPEIPLEKGLDITYRWISDEISKSNS